MRQGAAYIARCDYWQAEITVTYRVKLTEAQTGLAAYRELRGTDVEGLPEDEHVCHFLDFSFSASFSLLALGGLTGFFLLTILSVYFRFIGFGCLPRSLIIFPLFLLSRWLGPILLYTPVTFSTPSPTERRRVPPLRTNNPVSNLSEKKPSRY